MRLENKEYLRIDISLPSVTTVASVACKDISLDKASDVLLWKAESKLLRLLDFKKVTLNVINQTGLNLGYLFQPSSQRDEDEEHGRGVEECDGVDFRLLRHGHY